MSPSTFTSSSFPPRPSISPSGVGTGLPGPGALGGQQAVRTPPPRAVSAPRRATTASLTPRSSRPGGFATFVRVRIAMLAWEFPPLVVGGLAAHVDGLSRALARAGHEVVVLTLHHPDVPDDYEVEGVRVLRAHADLPWLPPEGMLAQMASANHKLVQLTARLGGWRPDLVHAHDWLVAWGGDTLRALWERPLVATIHATEKGRHGGNVPPGEPAGIHAVEWWLTYQASR